MYGILWFYCTAPEHGSGQLGAILSLNYNNNNYYYCMYARLTVSICGTCTNSGSEIKETM